MSSFGRVAFSLGLLSLFCGCAYGEIRQVLRAQVASEADCPDLVVQKASAYQPGYQPNQYVVRGCGIDRVYTCKGDEGLVAYGTADCTYKAAATAPATKTPQPAPEPDSLDVGDEPNG